MLIFIFGEDTFRSQQKVQEMEARFKEKFDPSGMNSARFDVSSPIGEVMQAVQSPPFLADKRMTIVKGLGSLKKVEAGPWIEGFQKTGDSSIVIFWDEMPEDKMKKTELYKAFEKGPDTHIYNHNFFSSKELETWIQQQSKIKDTQIEPLAVRELAERVGPDLWRLSNELNKLVAISEKTKINLQLVQNNVCVSLDEQLFPLLDALSRKDTKNTVRLIENERERGTEEMYLFSMLCRQVRLLLGGRALLDQNPKATKQDLANIMNLHPFVAGKTIEQARKFTLESLKNAHELLFQFDIQIKTGKIDVKLANDLAVDQLS